MRFFPKKVFTAMFKPHLDTLLNVIATFDVDALTNESATYALWESFRAIGILSYYAKRYEDKALALTITQSDANKVMLNFVRQHGNSQALLWANQNAFWIVANSWRLANKDAEQENTKAALLIDEAVISLINDLTLNQEYKQQLVSYGYLTSTYRGKSICEGDFAKLCHVPKLDDILPINHVCSDSLFIRAQGLTQTQLSDSCKRLTSQENEFHQLFATKRQPVANDLNGSLRVVIFDEWSQYHSYAPLLFDINTDNGGMYIEGTPADPDNQASFFAFKATWFEPEFKIWNLNHEYVHYLTGRFTTYGPFGHFKDSMVWWSEGIAELIAKGDNNPKVAKLNRETAADKRPTLTEIFATDYADGTERVYSWSYLAARYLSLKEPVTLVRLKEFIKNDFFDGYKKELISVAANHQVGFTKWLDAQAGSFVYPDAGKKETKLPHKINRYAYPMLLTPPLARNSSEHQRY